MTHPHRSIIQLLLFLLLPFVASCSSSDDPQIPTTPFGISAMGLGTVSKTGGTGTIAVRPAGTQATVQSDQPWCTIGQPTTSAFGQTYKVEVAPNADTADRTAVITITSNQGNETVTVRQIARDGLIVKTTGPISIGAEGGNANVELSTNGDFTGDAAYNGQIHITPAQPWVSVGATRAAMTSRTVSLAILPNVQPEARTTTVSFSLGDITESITIHQDGSALPDDGMTHTATQLAQLMLPGWNLGNTLEAAGSTLSAETQWQGTKTSQAVIDYVKAQGFRSIRIPCSWHSHSTDGVIDAQWMSRVKEIVGYCLKAGLYVVLNDHYDGGWIEVQGFSSSTTTYQKVDEATITAKAALLQKLWTQVAEAFKGYDEHLMFAGMNEPFQQYDLFHDHHAELIPILNRYNQAFVDAVRATGGNNALRTLVFQAPGADGTSAARDAFTAPADKATARLMMEFHYYTPWDFCGQEDNGSWFWGKANHVSGSTHNCSWGEEGQAQQVFAPLKAKFVDRGIPCIIGEYGALWRTLATHQAEHDASIRAWFQEVNAAAKANGMVPMAWDINGAKPAGERGTMTILDRANLSIFCTPALQGITDGIK